jgi:predicted TIM-barrel fold metal-dependent hydrolase
MIVDCHTHIFPEKIAPKVMAQNRRNLELEPYGAGTTSDLITYMDTAGVDYAIAFGVAPDGGFVRATNDWLMSQANSRLLLFGTITPDYEQWEAEIERIKAAGIVGVKFNPLFQDIRPEDRNMYPIYEKLTQEEMFVFYHAGKGSGRENSAEVRSTPAGLRRLHDDHPNLELICAHFGGSGMLDEVMESLAGTDVYLDTSQTPTCRDLDVVTIKKLINKHGTDRILYATDYPWARQGSAYGWEYEWLQMLNLSEKDQEMILGGNAQRLFGLSARN